MKIITDISIEFQIPKPEVEIVSTKTQLKTRYMPISNVSYFFKEFEYTDNSGKRFSYITHPRIHSELNLNEKVRYKGRTMALYQINQRITCECGCNVDIVDEIHVEAICPTCGLVHHQISV